MHIQVATTNSRRKRSVIEGKTNWALKKLQVKQPGIDEEEDMMSRHHAEVATEDEQLKEPLCRDI